jgi:hypothetical protein
VDGGLDGAADAADDGGPTGDAADDGAADVASPDAPADGNQDVTPGEGGPVDAVSDAGAGLTVLYVLGMVPPIRTDTTLLDRLVGRGYTVVIRTEAAVVAADADNKAAVLLSASTTVAQVMANLPALPTQAVPVLAMDENLEPFLKMTGPIRNTDRGATNLQTQVTIVGTDPALTAGLTGNVTVYTAPFDIGFGVPAAAATKVASVVGAATHLAIYAYPSGAMMVGQTAPAKRTFYFVRDNNVIPNLITEDALKLFDAIVDFTVR